MRRFDWNRDACTAVIATDNDMARATPSTVPADPGAIVQDLEGLMWPHSMSRHLFDVLIIKEKVENQRG